MKYRVAATIVAACVMSAGAAEADAVFTNGLYTVINYSGAYPDFNKIAGVVTPSYMDGVEANIGWRFNRFYSVEASYSYLAGSQQSGGTTFNNTLQDGSIDALGYLPFGAGSRLALYADVGGTMYFESHGTAASSTNADRFGARVGGGLQYQFDQDLGVRVGGRYEWMNLPNVKSAEVFAVGLVWQR